MYARLTVTQFSPYRLDEAISIARQHTLPAAQQQAGFQGYLMLVDRSTGRSITITLWEGEEDRRVTGPNGSYYREALGRVVPLLTDAPTVEDLELVIQA